MIGEQKPENSPEPADEKLENLIRQLRPMPSKEFYQRLENAPWRKRSRHAWYRRWGFAVTLVCFVILAGLMVIPPFRAMARNWINYFLPGTQDQLELSIDQLDHQQLFQYASPDNFPNSVDQIASLAGFTVSQPKSLPPGMELIGCRYESGTQTIVMLYRGAGYNLFLSQRPIAAGQEYFTIGASALVEPIWIGEIQGEYVSGGWISQSNQTSPETQASAELHVHWDNSLPQHTLRWQFQDFAYQLRSTGSTSPGKADLIALAAGIR